MLLAHPSAAPSLPTHSLLTSTHLPPRPLLPSNRPPRAAKVKSDHGLLGQLRESVVKASAAYALLDQEHKDLRAALAAAERERAALADSFDARSAALEAMGGRCAEAAAHGEALQGRLDEAARVHAALVADLQKLRVEAADKVGASGWRALGWVLGHRAARVGAARGRAPKAF